MITCIECNQPTAPKYNVAQPHTSGEVQILCITLLSVRSETRSLIFVQLVIIFDVNGARNVWSTLTTALEMDNISWITCPPLQYYRFMPPTARAPRRMDFCQGSNLPIHIIHVIDNCSHHDVTYRSDETSQPLLSSSCSRWYISLLEIDASAALFSLTTAYIVGRSFIFISVNDDEFVCAELLLYC